MRQFIVQGEGGAGNTADVEGASPRAGREPNRETREDPSAESVCGSGEISPAPSLSESSGRTADATGPLLPRPPLHGDPSSVNPSHPPPPHGISPPSTSSAVKTGAPSSDGPPPTPWRR
ncbi:classical arabinogalactan protein 9-like [Ischnura elegans]|uniref:classical arabinogalactan protein 9-like n=1 Tax=Ischnura elegans TaxID=197161 RepID=UPI001ED8883E|nr:classical arabinogalactan protein 9-like [Ischnura elegans]